jgi:Uncharacterized protein with SCP/PR1 domains
MKKVSKIMRRCLAAFLTLCLILSQSAMPAKAATADISVRKVVGVADYSAALAVHEIVNAERAKKGLTPLALDKTLTEAAMQRAAEITISFGHTRPNGKSQSTAYNWSTANGENIAMGQSTPEALMASLMNSSGHRDNIMAGTEASKKFTKVGVGCFIYSGRKYWVQVFSGGSNSTLMSQTGTETKEFEVQVSEKFVNPPANSKSKGFFASIWDALKKLFSKKK